jgi:hypothetical protein
MEEMGKFLNAYDTPKLDQENIKNLNRLIANNEIKTVIKSLPPKKSPGPDRFTADFHQTVKKLTAMLPKIMH